MDAQMKDELKFAVDYMKEVQATLDFQDVFDDYEEVRQKQKEIHGIFGKFVMEEDQEQLDVDFETYIKQ